MDVIRQSTIITGKKVTLVLIFDGQFSKLDAFKQDPKFMKDYLKKDADYQEYDEASYKRAQFANDFELFEKYQGKEGFSEDKDERKHQVDLKFFNFLGNFGKYRRAKESKKFEDFENTSDRHDISNKKKDEKIAKDYKFYTAVKRLQNMSFKDYQKIILSIFSKVLFYEIEHNPEHLDTSDILKIRGKTPGYLTSDKFTVELKFINTEEKWYFYYNYKASDIETACFYCSSLWFMQTIATPFILFEKTDYALIERYILHEFRHHLEFVRGWLVWDTKFEPMVRKFAKRKSMYGLLFLYKSLFNLKEEGIAEFSARINADRFDVNMAGVKEYNARLIQLSRRKRYGKSEEFFEKKVSSENSTPSSEYIIGRNMCLFIAMKLAKDDKSTYTIVAQGKEINRYDFPELNDWLKDENTIYIKNIDKLILDKAKKFIGPLKHYHFLRAYEGVCDEFRIEEDQRFMTSKRFHRILQQAIQEYEQQKKQRLESDGFLNIDDTPETAITDIENE